MLELYLEAFWQTLQMVAVSALVSGVLGIVLALVLVTTGPGDLYPSRGLNRVIGTVVRGHVLLAQAFGQVAGGAFGHPPGVDEHQGGPVGRG